jgi:outer membrane protein insertion porin family
MKTAQKIKLMVYSKIFFLMLLFYINTYARRVYIEKIEFQGNYALSKKQLLSVIESRSSSLFHKSMFSPFALNSDMAAIKSFYSSKGFLSTVVTNDVKRNKNRDRVKIIFKISEGPRIYLASLRISSNPVIDERNCGPLLSRTGEPFQILKIQSDANTLHDSIASKGYLKGVVVPNVVIDSNVSNAYVIFEVNPGPRIRVGDVLIDGLKSVKSIVVKRELEFGSNEILTSKKITDTQRNLYKTRAFNFLTIDPVISDSADTLSVRDTVVPVKIQVSQTKFLSIEGGIGYSAYETFIINSSATYANLFQLTHSLSLQINVSGIEQRIDCIYGIPWVFSLPINLNLSAYYDRRDNLLYTLTLPYTGAFNGFTVALSQNRSSFLSYSVFLSWENTLRISSSSPDTLSDISRKDTRSVNVILTLDKRDNVFVPSRGIVNEIAIELAGFGGGTNKFMKISNDLRGYKTIDSTVLLSSALGLGYAFPYGASVSVPVQNLFYAGGPRSVRGYDLDHLVTDSAGNPIGGNVELVMHLLEIQFPLVWLIKGAVFSDAGYVWQDIRSVNLRDLKFTAGPGLRLITPIGILRFDVGFKLNRVGNNGLFKMYLDFGSAF